MRSTGWILVIFGLLVTGVVWRFLTDKEILSVRIVQSEQGPEIRDQVVDYVRTWSVKTEVTGGQIQKWIGILSSTYLIAAGSGTTAESANTTAGFREITGLTIAKSRPSCSSTSIIRSQVFAALVIDPRTDQTGHSFSSLARLQTLRQDQTQSIVGPCH